jgi:hypothetical protein
LLESGSTVDFKFRSKLFNTYTEAVSAGEYDFAYRAEILYNEENTAPEISEMVIINPVYAVNPNVASENADKIGLHNESWDQTCCAAIYFIDKEVPTDWLMKYEIYFAEDGIEVVKNGELERFLQIEEDGDKFPSRLH